MRGKRWFLIATILLAGLLAFLLLQPRTDPVAQLQKELERLKQLGEPTNWRDIIKPVPAHLDGTSFYRQAIKGLYDARRSLPPSIWSALEIFGFSSPAAFNIADIRKGLKEVQPALKALQKAVKFPHMRLINWKQADQDPLAILYPHMGDFCALTRLLLAEVALQKYDGNIDRGVKILIVALKLTRRLGDEPIYIGFVTQGEIFLYAQEALQRLLGDADASPQAYRQLLAELRAWDIDRDLVRAIQMERIFMIKTFDRYRSMPYSQRLRTFTITADASGKILNLAWLLNSHRNLLAESELMVLRNLSMGIDIIRRGVPYDQQAVKQLETEIEKSRPKFQISLGKLTVMYSPHEFSAAASFLGAFERASKLHALQRIDFVVVALRLYRYERGHYPDNLHALVPKYLPSIPLDPYDGKPLRYRKLGKGFKVWSVGQDRKDDGGSGDDIVWFSQS